MKKIVFLLGFSMIVSPLFFPEAEACEQRSVDAVLIAKAMVAG